MLSLRGARRATKQSPSRGRAQSEARLLRFSRNDTFFASLAATAFIAWDRTRAAGHAGRERLSEKLHTDPNAASPYDAAAAMKLFGRHR
jgi:hypothetical protein